MKLKKLFAGLISLAAALLAVCAITVCAGAEWSGNYKYEILDDGTVEITDYTGSASKLTIPTTIDGKKVTSIGSYSFSECSSLTSLTIPNSVYTIYWEAFRYCTGLVSVTIPDSVTYIGYNVFDHCTNLSDIYYTGSKSQWNNTIFNDITEDTNATIHYNYKLDNSMSVSNLKVKARSVDAIRLSWDKCTTADGYIVEMNVNGIWKRAAKITNNSTVEFKKGGLNANTEYSFRIKAYKMSGNTAYYSNENYITACTNPTPITGLKVKARAADAVRLTWDKNTSADGYIIEMNVNGTWKRAGKITKNSIVVYKRGGLAPSTVYNFRVKTYKMSGNIATYSATKSISVRTNPTAISGLKLKARSTDAVRLTWNKNTSADGYIVEMNINGTWKRAAKITNNSTVEYKRGGLDAGTAYNFRVMAYKMSGKTALYGSAKTIAVRTNPTSVKGFKASYKTATTVDLTWDTNYSADGYIIERQNGTSWTRVKKITNEYSSYCTLTGLKPKTSYKFRIKAYKMSGSTALYSATKTISVTTTAAVNVTSVSLNKSSATMYVSDTLQLSATVSPYNATYNTVTYSSSNSKVASVSSKGLVRALSSGTATITASCGGKKATCKITVNNYSGVRGNYAAIKAYIDKNGSVNKDGDKYINYTSPIVSQLSITLELIHNSKTDEIYVYTVFDSSDTDVFSSTLCVIDYDIDTLLYSVIGSSSAGTDITGGAYCYTDFMDPIDPYFYTINVEYSEYLNYSTADDFVKTAAEGSYATLIYFAADIFGFSPEDLGFGV